MWSSRSRVALVVDDEPFARLFAAQILLEQGFVVLEAGDAPEAVRLLQDNEDVCLVLTDIAMPGAMDGLGLAAHVRLVRPDLPLIIASGRTAPIDRRDATKDRFLAKPYTATAMVEAVCDLTGQPSANQMLSIPLTMLAV